jgi:DNA invertase Pin-like site-specific DNA recombinase
MGRLTLNVLLSFAQFEREVTGERIRDKIAASKRKGMWMGGTVPMGYDVRDRKLVINEPEAETVRHIFRRYLGLGSGKKLLEDLRAMDIVPASASRVID